LKVTFLGTGTSQGVPVIACKCKVCLSKNEKDKRLRSSVLIEINNNTFAIDAGPDFRQQMLRQNIENLDAIFLTHEHKDHIAGLDDVRAFNYTQKKAMDIYGNKRTLETIKLEFPYVFAKNKYPGIPKMNLHQINNNALSINDIEFIPIKLLHHKLPVLGYRIKDFAYITDTNFIPDNEFDKLKNLKVLVINALRKKKHISHFNLSEALEVIEKIKPEKAYLNHISHMMGLHSDVEKELPKNVYIAYDGLQVTI